MCGLSGVWKTMPVAWPLSSRVHRLATDQKPYSVWSSYGVQHRLWCRPWSHAGRPLCSSSRSVKGVYCSPSGPLEWMVWGTASVVMAIVT